MSAFRAHNGLERKLARARDELARAAERGMEDALREFVDVVIHEPPVPPIDTGWLRASSAMFVNGRQIDADEYAAARQKALAGARTLAEQAMVTASALPVVRATNIPGITHGSVAMTAPYAKRMNYAFRPPGGPRSRLDPRVGPFFFTGKILMFHTRILEPLRRRMRDLIGGRTKN